MNRATQRTLRIAATLGIDGASGERTHAARTESLSRQAARLNASLRAGGVALIAGPSGTGKSTMLTLLSRTANTVVAKPLTPRQLRTRVAALNTRTPVTQWARLLARFGLAEAALLVSRAAELSTGEQARLELALAAAKCERLTSGCHHPRLCEGGAGRESGPVTLLIDEWCSVLDRPTAASVAAGAARWARERNIRLIGATAHSDLATPIAADIVITLNGQGERGTQWTGCGLSKAG